MGRIREEQAMRKREVPLGRLASGDRIFPRSKAPSEDPLDRREA